MATSWTIRLSPEAAKQLRALPRDHQATIGRAIDWMQDDPLQGDMQPLKGKKWKGRYRKHVGRYRIIFIPYHREHIDEVQATIKAAFPEVECKAQYRVDPERIYIDAYTKADDSFAVLDRVTDRLGDLLVEEGLGIYVVPLLQEKT